MDPIYRIRDLVGGIFIQREIWINGLMEASKQRRENQATRWRTFNAFIDGKFSKDLNLTSSDRLVFLTLFRWAEYSLQYDSGGYFACCALSQLCKCTGLSKTQVRNSIKKLKEAKLIRIERLPNRYGISTTYRVKHLYQPVIN